MIFQGYDQNDWVIRNNYQNRSREDILATWIMVNQHLSHLIEGLSIQILKKQTSKHNFHKICMNLLQEGQTTTLSYLIWDYLFHLEHHLSQIITDYEKLTKGFED